MEQALREKADVESILRSPEINSFFSREEIEQQRGQSCVVEFLRNEPVPRAMSAAAATVCEKH